MKSRFIFALFLLFAFSGCTKISVIHPLGEELEADKAMEIPGRYVAENGIWTIRRDDKLLGYYRALNSDHEWTNSLFTITEMDNKYLVLWVKDQESEYWIPFRISKDLESGALLEADGKQLLELITDGKISAQKVGDDHYMIDDAALPRLMRLKAFWNMDPVHPFIKLDSPE